MRNSKGKKSLRSNWRKSARKKRKRNKNLRNRKKSKSRQKCLRSQRRSKRKKSRKQNGTSNWTMMMTLMLSKSSLSGLRNSTAIMKKRKKIQNLNPSRRKKMDPNLNLSRLSGKISLIYHNHFLALK